MDNFKVGDRVTFINPDSAFIGMSGVVTGVVTGDCTPRNFFDFFVKVDYLEDAPTPFEKSELRLKENDDANA